MILRSNVCKCVVSVLIICTILQYAYGDNSDTSCDETIDITDGEVVGSDIIKDGITYTKDNYFVDGNLIKGCVCKVKSCIRRCCYSNESLGQAADDDISCQSSNTPINITDDLDKVIGQNVSLFHIISVPPREVCVEENEYAIFFNNSSPVVNSSGVLLWKENIYTFDKFCAANLNGNLAGLVCVSPDPQFNALLYSFVKEGHTQADVASLVGVYQSDVSRIAKKYQETTNWITNINLSMIISMPFLLITFLVYALLPDRNLHQRALMFYVLSLLVSYILLVTINLSDSLTYPWCEIFGYSTLFFFMVSFFWMNVICFDIWYTFSGGRGFVGSKRSSERRRLLLYSLYAIGVPILVVVIVFLMQKILPDGSEHNPGIGTGKCFLADGWPNLWYFYGEAGMLVIANIIFFLLTAFKIRQVKKETSMLKHSDSKRHSYEKDKQKFNLYVKLLFAMGVNWSMEVISWLVNWRIGGNIQYIWYATDFFNAIYGVFIFFIFVFKKKIWTLLKRRYYTFVGKPHLAHTMTSNNTRTSHYSSTNYSTADTSISDRTTAAANGRTRPEELALRRVT